MTHPPQNHTIIDSIQSEVASEASPMLEFLLRHARLFIIFVVCFIVAIIGYGFYSSQQEDTHKAALQHLGRLLVMKDSTERLKALEEYLPKAPAEVKNQTLFGIALAAQEAKAQPKAYAAWDQLRASDPAMKTTGTLGMAQALIAQKKDKEALVLLDGLLPGLPAPFIESVNSQIVILAENTGDYNRAAIACEALAANPSGKDEAAVWLQKASRLRAKLQGAK